MIKRVRRAPHVYGAFLLIFKALYLGGVCDPWAPGGGDLGKNYQLDRYPECLKLSLV